MNNETMMNDEELFLEEGSGNNAPVRKGRPRGKKSPDDFFGNLKTKMVMRIYGVSHAKALEIISNRESRPRAVEDNGAERSTAEARGEELMSAAEFFGAN